jgi:hypothetical protein
MHYLPASDVTVSGECGGLLQKHTIDSGVLEDAYEVCIYDT